MKNISVLDVCYETKFFLLDEFVSLNDLTIDEVESLGSEFGNINIFDTVNKSGEFNAGVTRLGSCKNYSIDKCKHFKRSSINCLQWYPVDSGMFITASADKSVKLWSSTTLKVVETIKLVNDVSWISFSNPVCTHNLIGAGLRYIKDDSSRVALVDYLMGSVAIKICGGHSNSGVTQILWSLHNSNLLITGGYDGRILYWDIRLPSKPVYSSAQNVSFDDSSYHHEGDGSVLSLSFSADGLYLLSWDTSNHFRMWLSDLSTYDAQNHKLHLDCFFDVNCTDILTPVRMATACGFGDSSYVFIPKKGSLFVILISKTEAVFSYMVTRHFSKLRACVWNSTCYELYTCGNDGNLFAWPLNYLKEK